MHLRPILSVGYVTYVKLSMFSVKAEYASMQMAKMLVMMVQKQSVGIRSSKLTGSSEIDDIYVLSEYRVIVFGAIAVRFIYFINPPLNSNPIHDHYNLDYFTDKRNMV